MAHSNDKIALTIMCSHSFLVGMVITDTRDNTSDRQGTRLYLDRASGSHPVKWQAKACTGEAESAPESLARLNLGEVNLVDSPSGLADIKAVPIPQSDSSDIITAWIRAVLIKLSTSNVMKATAMLSWDNIDTMGSRFLNETRELMSKGFQRDGEKIPTYDLVTKRDYNTLVKN